MDMINGGNDHERVVYERVNDVSGVTQSASQIVGRPFCTHTTLEYESICTVVWPRPDVSVSTHMNDERGSNGNTSVLVVRTFCWRATPKLAKSFPSPVKAST